MKNNTASQNYILTLNYAEYGPFLYFLNQGCLPIELNGKWKYNTESIQLSMCLPIEFDVSLIPQMWQEWKDESLDMEYAVQN